MSRRGKGVGKAQRAWQRVQRQNERLLEGLMGAVQGKGVGGAKKKGRK